jgi:transglutaminase-like putative cysteine protease
MMRALAIDSLSPFGRKLTWVIAALALAIVPHVPHLAPWILLLTAAAAAVRLLCEFQRSPLPPRWVRTPLALGALLAVVATYRTLNGVEAGTALLVTMAGMKLLETKNVRDLTVIVFLAYFAVFAAFLYNQELLLLPYLLATAWLLTATLMRVHQTTLSMPAREAAGLTGKMLLQALPLALLLFVFFPRLPGNFWSIPARTQAMTGLDDEVSPGDVSELSISGALAFRVNFDGPVPPASERYWRGPVMHDFDGRTWRTARTPFMPQAVEPLGTTYRYRITLEPHQRPWVFGLDAVTRWPQTVYRTSDLHLRMRRGQVTTLSSFDLESATEYRVREPLPAAMRLAALRLPENRNPRTLALARQLRSEHSDDQAFIDAVLRMFREQEYFYTLEPPRLELDSVDDFLFNTRQGFCEHFASAFTALARAAGIPARVVAGYQGGELNPMTGYLVIRQSDAHAWSEVWIDGRGWIRVDPTAAVAPERIQGGIDAALSDAEPVPGRMLRNVPLLSQLRLAWDAANTFWNNQIVEFSETQQRWLASQLGFEDISWRWFGLALVVTFIAFFIALSVYLAWTFRPRHADPVQQVYEALCKKFAQAGQPRLPHEGPSDYLTRIAAAKPELAAALKEARAIYLNLRYEPAPIQSSLSRLKFLVNQLELTRR